METTRTNHYSFILSIFLKLYVILRIKGLKVQSHHITSHHPEGTTAQRKRHKQKTLQTSCVPYCSSENVWLLTAKSWSFCTSVFHTVFCSFQYKKKSWEKEVLSHSKKKSVQLLPILTFSRQFGYETLFLWNIIWGKLLYKIC